MSDPLDTGVGRDNLRVSALGEARTWGEILAVENGVS